MHGTASVITEAAAALAEIRREDESLVAVLSGDWHLERPAPRFAPLMESALSAGPTGARKVRIVNVDASALGSWDSSLLIFLRQGQEYCDAHQLEFGTEGVPERIASLLALARAVPGRVVEPEEPALPPEPRRRPE